MSVDTPQKMKRTEINRVIAERLAQAVAIVSALNDLGFAVCSVNPCTQRRIVVQVQHRIHPLVPFRLLTEGVSDTEAVSVYRADFRGAEVIAVVKQERYRSSYHGAMP